MVSHDVIWFRVVSYGVIRFRMVLSVLSYKAQHGKAPDYLTQRFSAVSTIPGRSQLRSASSGQLVIPYKTKKQLGFEDFIIPA